MSQRTLVQKLGLKSGMTADIGRAKPWIFDLLIDLPEDIVWTEESEKLDWYMGFYDDLLDFKNRYPWEIKRLKSNASWWILCKKGLPKSENRLSRASMQEELKEKQMVDVLVCSINDQWSGYKFVKRVEFR